MNFDLLRTKIKEKFKTHELFANAIGVSRVTVSNWLNETQRPEEYRILDIINALDFTDDEVSQLMGEPPIAIVFRKVGASSSTNDIRERSKDIADTFFKIDGSGYVVKGELLKLMQPVEPMAVANHIRDRLGADKTEPILFNEMLITLKKNNINVFFMPFRKIGVSVPNNQSSNREVAFTAAKGERVIIFVDTERTVEEANFDICHELAHIALDHRTTSKEEEMFCNRVAQELVYPAAFLKEHLDALKPILSASAYSWSAMVHCFNQFYAEFDWSPKGLALSLVSNGLIEAGSHEFNRLMKLGSKRGRSIDAIHFNNFDPSQFGSIQLFFGSTIFDDKDLYKPFIELKEAASTGRLSTRRLAEILNIDSGDADELVRSWELEVGAEETQDEQHSTTRTN